MQSELKCSELSVYLLKNEWICLVMSEFNSSIVSDSIGWYQSWSALDYLLVWSKKINSFDDELIQLYQTTLDAIKAKVHWIICRFDRKIINSFDDELIQLYQTALDAIKAKVRRNICRMMSWFNCIRQHWMQSKLKCIRLFVGLIEK